MESIDSIILFILRVVFPLQSSSKAKLCICALTIGIDPHKQTYRNQPCQARETEDTRSLVFRDEATRP